MSEALAALGEPGTMPIVFRPSFIVQVRQHKRTHVFVPASYIPGVRSTVTSDGQRAAKGKPAVPTRLASVQVRDRLWVQEEVANLIDLKNYGMGSKAFYAVELPGGNVQIPGGYRREKWRTTKTAAKDMKREDSRYTLEVTAVRPCRAHDVTWPEIEREGTHDGHASKNHWWEKQYGLMMPWAGNPDLVGIDFRFIDANIDTGERWAPEEKPARSNTTSLLMERMSTPAAGCPHEKCPLPADCLYACKFKVEA